MGTPHEEMVETFIAEKEDNHHIFNLSGVLAGFSITCAVGLLAMSARGLLTEISIAIFVMSAIVFVFACVIGIFVIESINDLLVHLRLGGTPPREATNNPYGGVSITIFYVCFLFGLLLIIAGANLLAFSVNLLVGGASSALSLILVATIPVIFRSTPFKSDFDKLRAQSDLE